MQGIFTSYRWQESQRAGGRRPDRRRDYDASPRVATLRLPHTRPQAAADPGGEARLENLRDRRFGTPGGLQGQGGGRDTAVLLRLR